MSVALVKGKHFFTTAAVEKSAAIVDARAYYKAFYRAATRAQSYILLAGWQFDTEVSLLRGRDARNAEGPVTFLPFLEWLCQRRPGLRIYILAWDFSFVYALEREWLQDLKFATQTSDAIRFEFDTHPRYYASHHQKFAVIDGELAFAGGMDICDERWDDRGHVADDACRVNVAGEPCRPNHEVQAAVVGEAAYALSELFCRRWLRACGERLELPPPPQKKPESIDLGELTDGEALPLRAREVFLSRTAVADDDTIVDEIRSAYELALRSAERFVYIETQYFTSRSIAGALLARLRDTSKPKLEVLIVLPRGADSGKEKFALGETQDMVLGALEDAARTCGHEIRFLCSAIGGAGGDGTTFIHSKVLVVDDEFLSIGSANLTERSMGFDTELALFWQADGNPDLMADIARVRASLLAEHSGREATELLSIRNLAHHIDEWIAGSQSRLRQCHFRPHPPNILKAMIFDPGGPATIPEDVAASSVAEDRERLARGSSRLRRELERRSVPPSA
jgi:phosphatidylserine/phosphatidylglycerophosphate/cardiolipin synthase-like enzyme